MYRKLVRSCEAHSPDTPCLTEHFSDRGLFHDSSQVYVRSWGSSKRCVRVFVAGGRLTSATRVVGPSVGLRIFGDSAGHKVVSVGPTRRDKWLA